MTSNTATKTYRRPDNSLNEKIIQGWGSLETPYSQEAEEATIGVALLDGESFASLADILKPEDFFILRHRHIWEALSTIFQQDKPIDYLTLVEELKTNGKLAEIGGPAYLTQLNNSAPVSSHGTTYAQYVKQFAGRRRLMAVSDEIKALALNKEMLYEDVMVVSQTKLDSIMPDEKVAITPGIDSIQIYKDMEYDTVRRIEAGEMVIFPMPPEMGALTALVPSVAPGDFIVISGNSGSGKSCTMEQLGEHMASLGISSKYIHTEMSKEQVLHRRMARHSGIPYEMLKTAGYTATQRGYTPQQRERIDAAETRIAAFATHLSYEWMPDVEWSTLQMQMRRDAMAGVKVFLIDHFQDILVNPTGREDNAVRAYEKACIWLAAFAEKRHVVVVVASQENKQGKTKWTTKLKEKAVTLISIKRKELFSEYSYVIDGVEVRAFSGEKSPVAEYIVAKARFGKTGVAKLLNHGPRFRWIDLSAVHHHRRYPTLNGRDFSANDEIPQ